MVLGLPGWQSQLCGARVSRDGLADDPTLEKIVSGRPPTSSGTTRRPADILSHTMTTIWRPHWLIKPVIPVKEEVPDDDVPDVKVEPPADDDGINAEDEKTHLEGKGAKRKRGSSDKGAMRARGEVHARSARCVSACPHGRRRSQCKECGGSDQSASTVVGALSARSAVVHQSASTVWLHKSASTVVANSARSAVGHQSASTVVRRSQCKECGGSQICEHGRVRKQCKECGGASICEHGRQRSVCKECGGGCNLRARSCTL